MSQQQTQETTSDTISKSSSPVKRRGRPPKVVSDNPDVLKGNPNFKIEDPISTNPKIVSEPLQALNAGPTAEDLEFDRMLDRMANEDQQPAIMNEGASENKVTANRDEIIMIMDFKDNYAPAKTLNELREQVLEAKFHGAHGIEASNEVIKYYTKHKFPNDVGYFVYDSVRVYISGRSKEFIKKEQENTIENRLFGKSKVK